MPGVKKGVQLGSFHPSLPNNTPKTSNFWDKLTALCRALSRAGDDEVLIYHLRCPKVGVSPAVHMSSTDTLDSSSVDSTSGQRIPVDEARNVPSNDSQELHDSHDVAPSTPVANNHLSAFSPQKHVLRSSSSSAALNALDLAESSTLSIHYQSSEFTECSDPFFGVNFGDLEGGSPLLIHHEFQRSSQTVPLSTADQARFTPQAALGYLPMSPDKTPSLHTSSASSERKNGKAKFPDLPQNFAAAQAGDPSASEISANEARTEDTSKLDGFLLPTRNDFEGREARLRPTEGHSEELQKQKSKLLEIIRELQNENELLKEGIKEKGLQFPPGRNDKTTLNTTACVVAIAGENEKGTLEELQAGKREKHSESISREMGHKGTGKDEDRDMDCLRKHFSTLTGQAESSAHTTSSSSKSHHSCSMVTGDVALAKDGQVFGNLLGLRRLDKNLGPYVLEPATSPADMTTSTSSSPEERSADDSTPNIQPTTSGAHESETTRLKQVLESGAPRASRTFSAPNTPRVCNVEDFHVPSVPESETDDTTDQSDVPSDSTPSSAMPGPGQQNDESNTHHTLESRAPSPWQEIDTAEAERSITISTWWIIRRLGLATESYRLQRGNDSYGRVSAINSPTTVEPVGTVEGVTSGACDRAGKDSGVSSVNAAGTLTPDATPFIVRNYNQTNAKRMRNSNDEAGNSEDEDERPSRKRIHLAALEERVLRRRFACPYQKYDPLGSPFCCMPNSKNPEGGADTFARVKYATKYPSRSHLRSATLT